MEIKFAPQGQWEHWAACNWWKRVKVFGWTLSRFEVRDWKRLENFRECKKTMWNFSYTHSQVYVLCPFEWGRVHFLLARITFRANSDKSGITGHLHSELRVREGTEQRRKKCPFHFMLIVDRTRVTMEIFPESLRVFWHSPRSRFTAYLVILSKISSWDSDLDFKFDFLRIQDFVQF
jgi:hypothetical protein